MRNDVSFVLPRPEQRKKPNTYSSCFKAHIWFEDAHTPDSYSTWFSYDTQTERDFMKANAAKYREAFELMGIPAFQNQDGFWYMAKFILKKICLEQQNLTRCVIYANQILVPCHIYGKNDPMNLPMKIADIQQHNMEVWIEFLHLQNYQVSETASEWKEQYDQRRRSA